MLVGLTLPPVAVHLIVAPSGGVCAFEQDSAPVELVAVSLPLVTVTALWPVLPDEHVSVALMVSPTFCFAVNEIPGLIVSTPDIVQRTVPHALNGGGARADARVAGAIATTAGAASSTATVSVSHRRSMCGGPPVPDIRVRWVAAASRAACPAPESIGHPCPAAPST